MSDDMEQFKMFDPSKATKEEWFADESHLVSTLTGTLRESKGFAKFESTNRNTDAAECAILHNERLIMERRKPLRWFVFPWNDGWVVCYGNGHKLTRDDGTYFTWPHPIGLLSEADAYFRERGK